MSSLEKSCKKIFQSIHPLRGGTLREITCGRCLQFQSIHPLRGGTQACRTSTRPTWHFNPSTPCGVERGKGPGVAGDRISIHPPLAGWNNTGAQFSTKTKNISIPPPLAGWNTLVIIFLIAFFVISIPPPLAGWNQIRSGADIVSGISIPPPLAGWNSTIMCKNHYYEDFLSLILQGPAFKKLVNVVYLFLYILAHL